MPECRGCCVRPRAPVSAGVPYCWHRDRSAGDGCSSVLGAPKGEPQKDCRLRPSISTPFTQQPGTPEPPGTPPRPPPDPRAPPPHEDPPRRIPIPRPDEPPAVDDPPSCRNM